LEIESEPEELNKHRDNITRLEIAAQSLNKEKDQKSKQKLRGIKREIADLEEKDQTNSRAVEDRERTY